MQSVGQERIEYIHFSASYHMGPEANALHSAERILS
jgi:hypothetical protein